MHRSWHRLLALLAFVFLTETGFGATMAECRGDRVNVRSRAGFAGEVILQLAKGQKVQVLETVTLPKPGAGEPAEWAKIQLPPGAKGWVDAGFVDKAAQTVSADVLNVRAGPSYDHGVIARLRQGSRVKVAPGNVVPGWVSIEAPEGAYGFAPASFLGLSSEAGPRSAAMAMATGGTSGAKPAAKAEPSARATPPARGSTPASPPAAQGTPSPWAAVAPGGPAPARTSEPQPSPPTPTPTPAPVPASSSPSLASPGSSSSPWAAVAPAPGATSSPKPMLAYPNPALCEPLDEAYQAGVVAAVPGEPEVPAAIEPAVTEPGRWVRREGKVVRPTNFAAPTFHALQAADGGRKVNFLYTSRAEPIDWREYRGKIVVVTGREYLDDRPYWSGIPLLDVETIEVVP